MNYIGIFVENPLTLHYVWNYYRLYSTCLVLQVPHSSDFYSFIARHEI